MGGKVAAQQEPPKTVALTEADVRRIVRDEIANWRHDAAHSATAERRDKQHARDEASGFAVTDG